MKSSSVGFHNTAMPQSSPSGLSSNSSCMSMMCVTPSRPTFAMFSAFQIPPPTAIRSVTQVISIRFPYLAGPSEAGSCVADSCGAGTLARLSSPSRTRPTFARASIHPPTISSSRKFHELSALGEMPNPGPRPRTALFIVRPILRYRQALPCEPLCPLCLKIFLAPLGSLRGFNLRRLRRHAHRRNHKTLRTIVIVALRQRSLRQTQPPHNPLRKSIVVGIVHSVATLQHRVNSRRLKQILRRSQLPFLRFDDNRPRDLPGRASHNVFYIPPHIHQIHFLGFSTASLPRRHARRSFARSLFRGLRLCPRLFLHTPRSPENFFS